MGRDRCARRPVIGWLLGALMVFCAFLPATSNPGGSPAAARGAATLVRSGTHQQLVAVAPSLRPDVARDALHVCAAIPPAQPDKLILTGDMAISARRILACSTSLTSSVARAPPSVPA